MALRAFFRLLSGLSMIMAVGQLPAAEKTLDDKAALETIQKALSKKVLEPDQALKEMQAYCRASLLPLPQPKTIAEWEAYTANLRRQIFDQVIFRGEAAKWKDLPTEPVWLDTIPGGPGYSLKKLRFEAVPGMWVPAILYVPDKFAGKVPVVLAVNGHDRNGKAGDYKQMRCINLAKRGMLVLNLEWLNMGQLRSPDFHHGRMNQLDLCGTSGIAPFYLSMKRGLDILLAHPNADPKRVAVSGLSGGGWQTIFISSLDTRVTLCNPVAGYSAVETRIDHAKDLGDSEQAPVDLAKFADYTHLTALLAPRYALLTYNAKDECCFEAGYALPPLVATAQPFYDLYGKSKNLRTHVNHDPGTHNYLKENREAYYKMIGDFFFAGDKSYIYPEIPSENEIKTAAQLQVVFPEPNAGFNTLARQIAGHLPRHGELPSKNESAIKTWQASRRKLLQSVLGSSAEEASSLATDGKSMAFERFSIATNEKKGSEGLDVTIATRRAILGQSSQSGGDPLRSLSIVISAIDPIPANPIEGPRPQTLILADKGRASLAKLTLSAVRRNEPLILVDLPGFGDCAIPKNGWLFQVLMSSQGHRPLGALSERLLGPALLHDSRALKVVARGPRASLIALATVAQVARSRTPSGIASLELHDCPGSLKEILEKNLDVEEAPELFCFGLLEHFDVVQLTALCAPIPVTFVSPSERVRKELVPLRDVYRSLGSNHDPLAQLKK